MRYAYVQVYCNISFGGRLGLTPWPCLRTSLVYRIARMLLVHIDAPRRYSKDTRTLAKAVVQCSSLK